jgi:hypothetical protein
MRQDIAMLNYRIDKAALWEEHYEQFRCDHPHSELRERTIARGGKQCVKQCLRCGAVVSNPIKREIAIAENGGDPLALFDEEIITTWRAATEIAADKIRNAGDADFWRAYDEYLDGPVWREKRKKVFVRSGGVCEGCRDAPAAQVHHLTYAHVGDEFLFELVAVCIDCHKKLHSEAAPGAQ